MLGEYYIFSALGNHVIELERLSIQNLALDTNLKAGDFRELEAFEIESLLNKKREN